MGCGEGRRGKGRCGRTGEIDWTCWTTGGRVEGRGDVCEKFLLAKTSTRMPNYRATDLESKHSISSRAPGSSFGRC